MIGLRRWTIASVALTRQSGGMTMKNNGKRGNKNFVRTAGNTAGDLNLAPIDIERKYRSRISERFGVNPFEHTKNGQVLNSYTAL
jgi:hypothetical protein